MTSALLPSRSHAFVCPRVHWFRCHGTGIICLYIHCIRLYSRVSRFKRLVRARFRGQNHWHILAPAINRQLKLPLSRSSLLFFFGAVRFTASKFAANNNMNNSNKVELCTNLTKNIWLSIIVNLNASNEIHFDSSRSAVRSLWKQRSLLDRLVTSSSSFAQHKQRERISWNIFLLNSCFKNSALSWSSSCNEKIDRNLSYRDRNFHICT